MTLVAKSRLLLNMRQALAEICRRCRGDPGAWKTLIVVGEGGCHVNSTQANQVKLSGVEERHQGLCLAVGDRRPPPVNKSQVLKEGQLDGTVYSAMDLSKMLVHLVFFCFMPSSKVVQLHQLSCLANMARMLSSLCPECKALLWST